MIVNTELEQKGNLFPSEIIKYKKDVDTLHFSTKNNVSLQVTVVRDSVIRFRYSTTCKYNFKLIHPALGAGGRRFGSCHLDNKLESLFYRGFFFIRLAI